MSAPEVTLVFDTCWKLAAERYRIYEKRLRGEPPPWNNDRILQEHKFTNVFRACDRVSQYLIREVIYNPDASTDAEEVVFQILLFKLFNAIPAWEVLKAYAAELGNAKAADVKIWNRAYVQNQNYRTESPTKHERYLALVNEMMRGNVTGKLQAARTYADAFQGAPVLSSARQVLYS